MKGQLQLLKLRRSESGPDNPPRKDPNTTGGYRCQYSSDKKPGEIQRGTRIVFSYVREPGGGIYCKTTLNPAGYLNSITHDIQVHVPPILVDADTIRRAFVRSLERANIGWPCEVAGYLGEAKPEVVGTWIFSITGGLLSCSVGVFTALAGPVASPLSLPMGEACIWSAWGFLTSSALLLFDPPDSHYAQFVMTKPFAARKFQEIDSSIADSSCQDVGISSDRACQGLKKALRDHLGAQAWLGAITEAAAISANRFNTAKRDGNSDGQALQRAAWKVYAGMLRLAGEYAEEKSAELLRAYGPERTERIALTAAQVSQAKQELRTLELVPKSVIDRMRQNGFSEADLRTMVGAALDKPETPKEITLRSALSTPMETTAFRREYESISFDDVGLIVSAFRKSGHISSTLANELDLHLATAKAAATSEQRRVAMASFLKALFAEAGDSPPFENLKNAIATRPTKPLPLDLKPRDYIWFAAAPLQYR